MNLQQQLTGMDKSNGQGWQLDIGLAEPSTILLKLSGSWEVTAHLPRTRDVEKAIKNNPDVTKIDIDTSEVSRYDSGMVVWLIKIEKLCADKNIVFNKNTLPTGVQRLFQLAHEVPPRGFVHEEEDTSVLGNLGAATRVVVFETSELLGMIGATLVGFARLLSGKAIYVKKDILRFIQAGGHQALGIVSLAAFLIGITLAIIGITQLRKYGAEAYIANIAVIGVLRELGCLVTGIVMAGRTASSYAAEIGAMQVHEELDALHSLAISRVDFLVMPRVIGLMITMPFLVIYANVIANFGGLMFSVFVLNVSYLEYIMQARDAFEISDFIISVVKAGVFGYLIAIAGCFHGMQCGRSVAAVGDVATYAVVSAMVLIIMANVVVDLMLFALGI